MPHNLQFAQSLYDGYETYKEKSLFNRRFKHSDIVPLIEQLKNKNIFKVKKVGESVQGRDIFLISIGTGAKKIFCWSQMHGDEPTATAAIFDIFNFFLHEDHYIEFKNSLLNNVTLFFLPMVNPDGAELFQRFNILDIDLNRDAARKQSPESKVLYSVFNKINPDFGFNLHDQGREYSAGIKSRSAVISFLAPPFDYAKTINDNRTNSMKLISKLYNILSAMIPGHIAKYKDDHEPRAFGDNFSKSNTSIILIESGAWRGDREKQFLRKLNFVSLLTFFKSIAEDSYLNETIETYYSIPPNESLMIDCIIRNVTVIKEENEIVVDVGINYEEINIENSRQFYYKAAIEDIGDLSVYTGFREFDATGMSLQLGKTYAKIFNSLDEIKKLDFATLIETGVTNVKLRASSINELYSPVLFNIILNDKDRIEELKQEAVPNFILKENNTFKCAVINGFLLDPISMYWDEGNSLIFK